MIRLSLPGKQPLRAPDGRLRQRPPQWLRYDSYV